MEYARVAVVIPALDEEESLPFVLDDLPPVGFVIVVDNGSRDRTAEVARAKGAIVVAQPCRGYGSACLAGLAAAEARGAEYAVILDADHSSRGADVPVVLGPLLRGEAELVLGDRTTRAAPGSLMPVQRLGNALSVALIAALTGRSFLDMGSLRAARIDALRRLAMGDRTYGWNIEMQLKAVRRGLRVVEIPVDHLPRRGGQSKVSGSVRGTIRASAKILYATARHARG